jgi:hypothetical protein
MDLQWQGAGRVPGVNEEQGRPPTSSSSIGHMRSGGSGRGGAEEDWSTSGGRGAVWRGQRRTGRRQAEEDQPTAGTRWTEEEVDGEGAVAGGRRSSRAGTGGRHVWLRRPIEVK